MLMITGDIQYAAKTIRPQVGIIHYRPEVQLAYKGDFEKELQQQGR